VDTAGLLSLCRLPSWHPAGLCIPYAVFGGTLPPFLPGKSHIIPRMEEEMPIFKSLFPFEEW